MEPQIRYARTSDGVNIAWFGVGSGVPYIWPGGGGPGIIENWRVPETRAVFESIARQATLITYDPRGFGLSDRGPMEYSCEHMVRDLEAVSDAASPAPFILQTFSQMSVPGIAYAARHPERVRALVLLNGILRGSEISEGSRRLVRLAEEDWDSAMALVARSNEGSYASASTLEQNEELTKRKTPKDAYIALSKATLGWDAGDVAGGVETPAIVVHYTQSLSVSMEACRRLATTLPNATFVSAEAEDSAGTRVEHVRSAVTGFLGSVLAGTPATRGRPVRGTGTAVILFTDIADSAALTERMGDAAFREASRALDTTIRTAIREAGGSPVEGKVLGDGVMGVFSSAAQAISAASQCVRATSELPLHIGLHAGDVLREQDNVYGGAVNIASRICGLCEPGEILVSQTVRDLARTSAGVAFEDRGEQALKGIADPVRVFAVRLHE